MSALTKFDGFNRKVALVLEGIGLAAMVIMVFLTNYGRDRGQALLRPIYGALDAVSLLQLVAISFAASITLITGRHIEVEFLTALLPEKLQHVVDFFVKLLCFTLFVALAWYMFVYAHHLQAKMENNGDCPVSVYPFAYGAAIACNPVCLVYISLIIKCFKRMIGNDA